MVGMRIDEFVLARVAEDEAVARAAISHGEGCLDWSDEGDPTDVHIARHDPARVLAECAAKRRIVEQITSTSAEIKSAMPGGSGRLSSMYGLERTLHLLAQPYADHPDYREEWRA